MYNIIIISLLLLIAGSICTLRAIRKTAKKRVEQKERAREILKVVDKMRQELLEIINGK